MSKRQPVAMELPCPTGPPHAGTARGAVSGLWIIGEALDKQATPRVRNEVIERSLSSPDFEAVPDDPQGLARYIGGPLYEAVEHRLGDQAAACLIEDLGPILRGANATNGRKPTSRVRRRADPPAEASCMCIVVVDDDADLRLAVAQALRRRGHRVVVAPDGHIALAMCTRNQPDLIISDVDMPTMSGTQMAWLLALRLGADSPPVVLWTGGTFINERPENVLCVLAKPELDGLFEAVELAASRQPSARVLEGEPRATA